MSDLIRREGVIKALENSPYCYDYWLYIKGIINGIPSAVPTPHGNLVDLDAMVDKFWDGDYMEIHCRDLDYIPVIVEAEADHK